MDSVATNNVILGGHEDGVVKLYDLRSNSVKQHKSFESTSPYTSQVRICPKDSNLFVSASYDGKVRVWDLRNEMAPLYVLKRKQGVKEDEFKQFALTWNIRKSDAQIISGGSDSNISIHSLDL